MTIPTIAMIGAGNMGSSLIGGMIKNGHPSDRLIATSLTPESRDHLQQTFGIKTYADNSEAASLAEVVILAVKPQVLQTVASSLKDVIQQSKPLVISVAAGVRTDSLQEWLGGEVPVARIMPNTPALIGAGASGLFATAYVSPEQHDIAESIARAVGVAVWVQTEEQLDIVTALSGSGPAYFFLILEALQDSAEKLGLPAEAAQILAQQTALGAALMAIESSHSPAELRQNVTSPGGTTERGVATLEALNIRDMFNKTLLAAKLRSEELASLLGDKK